MNEKTKKSEENGKGVQLQAEQYELRATRHCVGRKHNEELAISTTIAKLSETVHWDHEQHACAQLWE